MDLIYYKMKQVDIKGFEGYQITDDGRVWSIKRKIWLKPCVGFGGYYQVSLRRNGETCVKKIHKLVAETFIPNPDNKPCIDHCNTIRTDNRVSNLRWVTHKENSNNPISLTNYSKAQKGKAISEETRKKISETSKGRHHTEDTKKKMSKLMTNNSKVSKQVYQYTLDGELVAVWKSTMDCERNGFNHSEVGRCCNGTRGRITYKNYIWKYAE